MQLAMISRTLRSPVKLLLLLGTAAHYHGRRVAVGEVLDNFYRDRWADTSSRWDRTPTTPSGIPEPRRPVAGDRRPSAHGQRRQRAAPVATHEDKPAHDDAAR